MTLQELKSQNSDIILGEVDWADVPDLANGAALFYASLAKGGKPRDQRAVLWAGQVLTVGFTGSEKLMFLRATTNGNPKIDSVDHGAIESDRSVLFYTKPFSAYDYRNWRPWDRWEQKW